MCVLLKDLRLLEWCRLCFRRPPNHGFQIRALPTRSNTDDVEARHALLVRGLGRHVPRLEDHPLGGQALDVWGLDGVVVPGVAEEPQRRGTSIWSM